MYSLFDYEYIAKKLIYLLFIHHMLKSYSVYLGNFKIKILAIGHNLIIPLNGHSNRFISLLGDLYKHRNIKDK